MTTMKEPDKETTDSVRADIAENARSTRIRGDFTPAPSPTGTAVGHAERVVIEYCPGRGHGRWGESPTSQTTTFRGGRPGQD